MAERAQPVIRVVLIMTSASPKTPASHAVLPNDTEIKQNAQDKRYLRVRIGVWRFPHQVQDRRVLLPHLARPRSPLR